MLDERATSDPEFERELRSIIDEARQAGVDIGSVTQVVWGNQNVQAAGLVDSQVNVSYGERAQDRASPPE